MGVIYLERDKSLERLTLHAYFLHLKLKIIFLKFTKYSMFTDRIIKIIFFDNSFIVKIYVKKMNFFKCHFFSIGDTAVADRLRAFSKSVLGSPFRGLPTSQFWGGVLGNFLALFSNEPKFFTLDMVIWWHKFRARPKLIAHRRRFLHPEIKFVNFFFSKT